MRNTFNFLFQVHHLINNSFNQLFYSPRKTMGKILNSPPWKGSGQVPWYAMFKKRPDSYRSIKILLVRKLRYI